MLVAPTARSFKWKRFTIPRQPTFPPSRYVRVCAPEVARSALVERCAQAGHRDPAAKSRTPAGAVCAMAQSAMSHRTRWLSSMLIS
jgi:hypothetical protein